jgi:hypothetical protein
MNQHPILFSGEMVRAILEGRKTQTRRVMKPQPSDDFLPFATEWYAPTVVDRNGDEQPGAEIFGVYDEHEGYRCPYGAPGDRLWVRETFGKVGSSFVYKANFKNGDADAFVEFSTGITVPAVWKPSIHMPRVACRIMLEVIDFRVERLHDITAQDCEAEGVGYKLNDIGWHYAFGQLWNQINEKRGFGWDVNPWVWVIEFKQVTS